jgi:threonine synthase
MKTREETCIRGHFNGIVWGRGVTMQSGSIERRPGSGRDASHAGWRVHCTAYDSCSKVVSPIYGSIERSIPSLPINRKSGLEKTWFNCGHLNPSGSFKDRSAAVAIACALKQGCPGVICDSSGNAAVAAATYAACAGLPAHLVVSSSAPRSKLSAATSHGARTFRVAGDFSRAFAVTSEAAAEAGLANLTTSYVNCYAYEGISPSPSSCTNI